ncbi:MAG TPA: cytochrome c oxidase subunit II [Thermoanaerobaculia bacterium]|jgi:cytochrome c oxidase subunit 2
MNGPLVFLLLTNWTGGHSALHPMGPQAGHINDLWWLMFWVCAAVFVLVMVATGFAITRRSLPSGPPGPIPPASRRRMTGAVAGAIGVTVLILFALLIASVSTGRAIASLSSSKAPVIRLTGHQWWWEVEYQDPHPDRMVLTANEIHIPAGRPVLIQLSSNDVIHSFWVPNLHGKRDLIPGHDSEIWIQADKPGIYRGFCAEFCGYQHAHMGLLVIADPPDRFDAWYSAQLQSSVMPATPLQQRGRQLVEASPCAVCHSIQGTQAGGKLGPDLTHLASRRTLAAATLANNRGNLAGWILDPQTVKPGNHMPGNSLGSEDLQAILDYLESLK